MAISSSVVLTKDIINHFATKARQIDETQNSRSMYTLYNINEDEDDLKILESWILALFSKSKLSNIPKETIIKNINEHSTEPIFVLTEILNIKLSQVMTMKKQLHIYDIEIYSIDSVAYKNGINLKITYYDTNQSNSHMVNYYIEHFYKKHLTTKEKTLIILGSIFGFLILGMIIFLIIKFKKDPKTQKIKKKRKEWKTNNKRRKNDWN